MGRSPIRGGVSTAIAAGVAGFLGLACQHVRGDEVSSACAECHTAELATWQESFHAKAATNRIFEVSWAEQRSPWCLECHQRDLEGVGCTSCHGARAVSCAQCHQFDLPLDIGGAPSGTAGQDTWQEWHGSSAAALGKQCTGCHDPHASRGGRDPELVRKTLSARVTRVAGGVSATVTARGAGHAVPTGDPFRRLRLVVCADLACSVPISEAWLQRRLERDEDRVWRVTSDNRVPAPTQGEAASRILFLPAHEARSWRLYYHLADPRHQAIIGSEAIQFVASGLVEGR